jgi:hypothetical protein
MLKCSFSFLASKCSTLKKHENMTPTSFYDKAAKGAIFLPGSKIFKNTMTWKK